jgi:hypothetical protein
MFNRKTLFIIGAGAGVDIGLPIGRLLAEDIAWRTTLSVNYGRVNSASDHELAYNFFERGDPKEKDFYNAFRRVHDGILLSKSIDDFLNVHDGSPEIVQVGKAAISRAILEAERKSKLFVEPSNAYNKLQISSIRDSWLVKFMQVLTPGRNVSAVENVLDDVSFINFNYDRCLEHFLVHSLQLMYGVNSASAAQIVAKAQIIHPYGSIGSLDEIPFGGNVHGRTNYRGISQSIKIYTEQIDDDETIFGIQRLFREASCIVFLGFAYHRQNMELLFERHSSPLKTTQIFGTAFGMSDADRDEVISELEELFPAVGDEDLDDPTDALEAYLRSPAIQPKDTSHIHIENKIGCSELFDYYAKSLAG